MDNTLDFDDSIAFASQDWKIPDWETPSPAVYGSPTHDAAMWAGQTTAFTCAVVSQQMILNQFGIPVRESQLVYDATAHGWLTDQGTSPTDLGQLLEHYGVAVHFEHGANVAELLSELAHGHKVIAAVDSGELWGQDWFFQDWIWRDGADHALVVTGIDLSDPGNPQVIVNDPGEPTGAGHSYPLDQFLKAWDDSGSYYVATDHAPDDLMSQPLIGQHFHPATVDGATGIYMDTEFWIDFATRAFGAVVVAELSESFGADNPVVFVADVAISAFANLTEADRNRLFELI